MFYWFFFGIDYWVDFGYLLGDMEGLNEYERKGKGKLYIIWILKDDRWRNFSFIEVDFIMVCYILFFNNGIGKFVWCSMSLKSVRIILS